MQSLSRPEVRAAAATWWRVSYSDRDPIDVTARDAAEAASRGGLYGSVQQVTALSDAVAVDAQLDRYRAVYAQALDWCREQGVSPHSGIHVMDAYDAEDGMAVEASVSISAAAMHRLGLSRDNATADGGWHKDRLHLRWQVAPRVAAWVVLHAADLDGEAA